MKLRYCKGCDAPISLRNHIRQFVCPNCGMKQSAIVTDLRSRVDQVRRAEKSKGEAVVNAATDFSRRSFSEAVAPHDQACACDCGGRIKRGQTVYARPLLTRGRPAGTTRIIDLEDHYERWFEYTAHKYAHKAAEKIPGLGRYLGNQEEEEEFL